MGIPLTEGVNVGDTDPVDVPEGDEPEVGDGVPDGEFDGVTVCEPERVPLKEGVLVRDVVPDVDWLGVTVIVLLGDAPEDIVAVGVHPGSNVRPGATQ